MKKKKNHHQNNKKAIYDEFTFANNKKVSLTNFQQIKNLFSCQLFSTLLVTCNANFPLLSNFTKYIKTWIVRCSRAHLRTIHRWRKFLSNTQFLQESNIIHWSGKWFIWNFSSSENVWVHMIGKYEIFFCTLLYLDVSTDVSVEEHFKVSSVTFAASSNAKINIKI